jgi:hypothetical protein
MRHFFMPAHRFGYAARRTLIRAADTLSAPRSPRPL